MVVIVTPRSPEGLQIHATLKDHMGTDLSVVNAARVSFGKESEWKSDNKLLAKDKKLIHYLAQNKHFSPFGHAFASFHIKAPVFVARQLVKHKFLRWNEISRRYVSDTPEFYRPEVWRGTSEDKKQGSEGVVETTATPYHAYNACIWHYQQLLKDGVAPEQARMVLPQSMMTEWYWSGSLDAFADCCRLRCAPDTQSETREVALQIAAKMEIKFPVSWDALMK